jgi:hypothetical protein
LSLLVEIKVFALFQCDVLSILCDLQLYSPYYSHMRAHSAEICIIKSVTIQLKPSSTNKKQMFVLKRQSCSVDMLRIFFFIFKRINVCVINRIIN